MGHELQDNLLFTRLSFKSLVGIALDPGDGDGERKPSRPLTVPLAFTQLISLLAGPFDF